MIEIVYANPNISRAEANKLVSEGVKRRKSLHDTFIANIESIESQQDRERYISACVPFLGMF